MTIDIKSLIYCSYSSETIEQITENRSSFLSARWQQQLAFAYVSREFDFQISPFSACHVPPFNTMCRWTL